jgi:hypothetical protein
MSGLTTRELLHGLLIGAAYIGVFALILLSAVGPELLRKRRLRKTSAPAAATRSSCAAGTRVRMADGTFERVENLFEGAELVSLPDEDPVRVIRPLAYSMKSSVKIRTDAGQELICTRDHALLPAGPGERVRAAESLNRHIRVRGGAAQVIEVQEVGERRVVHLELDPPYVYEADGILSEE